MTLKPITIIAAFLAITSCGGPQESDQTPAGALLGRLEAQINEGKIMFGHQESADDFRTFTSLEQIIMIK